MGRSAGDFADEYWAGLLPRVRPERAAPMTVAGHRGELVGYQGVYAVQRRGHVVLSAPTGLVEVLRARRPRPEEVMDPGWWQAELPGWLVLGPSVHSFLDHARCLPRPGVAERADVAQIAEALGHRVSAAEWAESGFAGEGVVEAWLLRDDSGRPVAAANLTPVRGLAADLGVVTAADARGGGHGRAVSAEAVRWSIERHGIARWRALESNAPSRRLAAALGFTDDCRQLAVRPRNP